jgi:hypothetical protein
MKYSYLETRSRRVNMSFIIQHRQPFSNFFNEGLSLLGLLAFPLKY